MSEWITVKEAADVLKVSERTVRRRIESGKLKARRDGRSWLIHSSLSEEGSDATDVRTDSDSDRTDEVLSAESELVKELRERVQDQKEQIERLEERLTAESDRRDALIMQITRITEQNQQLMLADKRPFWQRWRRKRDKDASGG